MLLPVQIHPTSLTFFLFWKKCTGGPSTCQRDTKTSSNRKTRYAGSLNYTKPVTRGPLAVLIYVAAESAWDPHRPHVSACLGQPLPLSPLLSHLSLTSLLSGKPGRVGRRSSGRLTTRRRQRREYEATRPATRRWR